MRVDRSLTFLTILAVTAACGGTPASDAAPSAAAAPAAAAPDPAPVTAAPVAAAPEVSVRWDSRPLDIEYQRERDNLNARFKVEISTPRPSESPAERERRQAAERKALDDRYERGKREHARGLPPS